MRLRTYLSPPGFVLALVGGVYFGFAIILLDLLVRWDKYDVRATAVLQVRIVVLLFGLVCLAVLLWRLRKGLLPWLGSFRSWLPVRLALYILVLALIATTLADLYGLLPGSSFLIDRFFANVLLAGLGLWAILLLTRPSWFAGQLTGIRGMLDVAMFNFVVVLVSLEAAVTIWATNSTSPLFLDFGSARANIEMQRREPNEPYFNFTHNSRGYHDTEFFPAKEDDFVVALLADSFGVGVVPYDFNFATVAEKRLQEALRDRYRRIAIHNFGVPGIGVPEYAYLLETEVPQISPRLVVLAVFVGNDIEAMQGDRSRASLSNWWIGILAYRLWVVRAEPDQFANVAEIGKPTGDRGPVPDFVFDVSKEEPAFSEEAFLEIEWKRLRVTNTERSATQRRFRELFDAVDKIHASLGDRLLLVVIPDEFQVNDTLYEALLARAERPEVFDRDLPQRLLRDYADARDIPILDLLPALRVAEPEGRTYHLRDTHWNARGNRVAGEAIAGFILNHLD